MSIESETRPTEYESAVIRVLADIPIGTVGAHAEALAAHLVGAEANVASLTARVIDANARSLSLSYREDLMRQLGEERARLETVRSIIGYVGDCMADALNWVPLETLA